MKKKIIIISGISVILIILFTIFTLYRISNRNAVERLIAQKKMINILIAGSNSTGSKHFKFFSILSLNPDNGNIGVTFIPPSLKIKSNSIMNKPVQIKDTGIGDFDKIRESIEKDLKLNIQFYVQLYGSDVQRAVNLLEGLDVFMFDQFGKNNQDFGVKYLDGNGILKYINSAVDNSVFVKFDRILDLISTVYYNKENFKKYKNLSFIIELFKNIKTNLMPQEILSLSEIFFKEGNIYSIVVPGDFQQEYFIIDEISCKIYETDFLTPFIMNKNNDASMKIKVLNGTSSPGLARKMRNILNRDGLNVVEFGTSPYLRNEKSVIICRKGEFASLKKVSEISGITNIHYVIDSTQMNNILIVIGEDMVK